MKSSDCGWRRELHVWCVRENLCAMPACERPPARRTDAYSYAADQPEGATWDTIVSIARFGQFIFSTVFKIRSVCRDIRSQIYEIISKREIASSHGGMLQKQNVLPNYGGTAISENKVTQIDDSVKGSHSFKDGAIVTDRTLLASALMSVAQNDAERHRLTQYKAAIAEYQFKQDKLTDLVDELSTARHEGDTEKISKLERGEHFCAQRSLCDRTRPGTAGGCDRPRMALTGSFGNKKHYCEFRHFSLVIDRGI